MLKKIVSMLSLVPLLSGVIATVPLQSPAQAQVFTRTCLLLVMPNVNFKATALYPHDPNVYSGSLKITNVKLYNTYNYDWSGVLNIDGVPQNVSGSLADTNFTLRRSSGQNWTGNCYNGGISGNFIKDDVPNSLGTFVIKSN